MLEMTEQQLKNIVEAAILAAGEPLNIERLCTLFEEERRPEKKAMVAAIEALQADCEGRGIELRELATGYRYQARSDVSLWVSRLWDERAPRYSRALLETLALVAYRQPITRAEIEDIRGVAVSSSIMKTLMERSWVRIIGHRDVPGRPALYASTKEFLDYFNLKTLDELPTLGELKDLDKFNAELDLRFPGEGVVDSEEGPGIALTISADFEPVHYD
jgi:segregation and condensation protein B